MKIKWNKVENKVPSFYADVIVWDNDVRLYSVAFASEINGEFEGFKESKGDGYFLNSVTHWRAIGNVDAPNEENTN